MVSSIGTVDFDAEVAPREVPEEGGPTPPEY